MIVCSHRRVALYGITPRFRSRGHESVIQIGVVFGKFNEPRRDMIGEPDVIGRHKEDESFLHHFKGVHFQQDRRSSPTA